MGDERRAATAPGTTPGPETGRRHPDAFGSAPATQTETVGGGDGEGEPATAAATANPAGLSLGPETAAEATSPADTEAYAPEKIDLDYLEFQALRGIRYHEDRGSFLDLWRRILDFCVVALGTAAVASLFAEKSTGAVAMNVATALVGALQLVANLSDKAQEHRWARRKFCDLLARITEAKQDETVSQRDMRKLTKRWTEIWSDEPTTMHVLEAVAYNATARALNRTIDPDDLIEIPLWRSALRNWLAQEDFEHLTPRERRAATKDASGTL